MVAAEHTATITPQPDVPECDKPECDAGEMLALVEPDQASESGVFCPPHRVAFLREVVSE